MVLTYLIKAATNAYCGDVLPSFASSERSPLIRIYRSFPFFCLAPIFDNSHVRKLPLKLLNVGSEG